MWFKKRIRVANRWLCIRQYLAVNAVYITLLLTALTVDFLRDFILQNSVAVLTTLVIFEIATLVAIILMNDKIGFEPTSREEDSEDFATKYRIRFGDASDFAGCENVYHEHFSRSLSVDDAEVLSIFSRRYAVRVIEVFYNSGTRRISGYYTVWPMERTTFDRLVEGDLKEKELTANDVLAPSDPRASFLYLPEIAASQFDGFSKSLQFDAKRYIRHLLEEYPHCLYVGAWAYTEKGKKLLTTDALMKQCKRANGKLTEYYMASRTDALAARAPNGKFAPTKVFPLV